MGYAAAIYISEMHEDNNNITEILSSTRFREEAFVSEHFDREKNDHIGIPVKEKTLLITDIDPKTIVFNEIEQSGAIQKK